MLLLAFIMTTSLCRDINASCSKLDLDLGRTEKCNSEGQQQEKLCKFIRLEISNNIVKENIICLRTKGSGRVKYMERIYQEFLCRKKPWRMNYGPSQILFLPQDVKFMPLKRKEQKSGFICKQPILEEVKSLSSPRSECSIGKERCMRV